MMTRAECILQQLPIYCKISTFFNGKSHLLRFLDATLTK